MARCGRCTRRRSTLGRVFSTCKALTLTSPIRKPLTRPCRILVVCCEQNASRLRHVSGRWSVATCSLRQHSPERTSRSTLTRIVPSTISPWGISPICSLLCRTGVHLCYAWEMHQSCMWTTRWCSVSIRARSEWLHSSASAHWRAGVHTASVTGEKISPHSQLIDWSLTTMMLLCSYPHMSPLFR